MRNILKLGLISAVTAIALAQTPATAAQGMDEDVLAIATRGALSDSMQGFRKLADDEAGSIFGGLAYSPSRCTKCEYGYPDQYNFLAYFTSYYPLELTSSEKNGGRLNIGAGESYSDYNDFVKLEGSVGGLAIRLEVNFQTNTTRQSIVNGAGNAISSSAFTNRLLNFSRIYYLNQFGNDRAAFARERGYY